MVKSVTRVFNISEPTPEPDEFDAFNVAKVYGDAPGSVFAVSYVNMANPRTPPVDRYPGVYRLTNSEENNEEVAPGVRAIAVQGTTQCRVAIWSPNNKPWGNVEHTVYAKFLAGPTDNGGHNDAGRVFQPYIGGGHHHSSGSLCVEGNAMKLCFFGGGDLAHRKEITHPAYCGDRGHYNNWAGLPHGTAVWRGPIQNFVPGFRRWYGYKHVQILLSDRNRQEVYIDEGADDNGRLRIAGNAIRWRLLAVYEDIRTGTRDGQPIGDWVSSRTICSPTAINQNRPVPNGFVRLEPYGITHSASDHGTNPVNAACCTLRIDGATKMVMAYWSARMISPSNKLITR